jgi:hypothetical protein
MMCAVHHVPYKKVLCRMRGKTVALISGVMPVTPDICIMVKLRNNSISTITYLFC